MECEKDGKSDDRRKRGEGKEGGCHKDGGRERIEEH